MWITFLQEGRGIEYHYNHDMEPIRITKIVRSGSSLAIVIPKEILQAVHLQRGDQIIVCPHSEGTIVLRKISNEEILKLKIPNI